jgi:hypothetical protein
VPPTPAEQALYRPPAPAGSPAPILPRSPGALGIPTTGHRFVVLLAVWEQGTPPPELTTTNGFLNLYVPQELAGFWVKGNNYEYTSPRYEAKYTCLEVFSTASEALAVYPEGQPTERMGGAAVRWKPISSSQMQQIVAGESPWKRR